jgi:hypothetical protein
MGPTEALDPLNLVSYLYVMILSCGLVARHKHKVSSGESVHKKENQLVPHTQWLKSYPHAMFGNAGPSPLV